MTEVFLMQVIPQGIIGRYDYGRMGFPDPFVERTKVFQ